MGIGGFILRRLRASILDEPNNFSWVIEGKLAASAFPASRGQLRWIVRRGVNSILTLTEYPIMGKWLNGLDLRVKHIPMADHGTPRLEYLIDAASYIERELKSGRTLLVHCLAGKGRTGCVLAAYFIRSMKMSAREAVELVRRKRPGSIEYEQELYLIKNEEVIKLEDRIVEEPEAKEE